LVIGSLNYWVNNKLKAQNVIGLLGFIEFVGFLRFRYNINPLDWNRVAIGNWK